MNGRSSGEAPTALRARKNHWSAAFSVADWLAFASLDLPFMAGTVGNAMNNYAAVLEQGPRNWSAYVPDLPGCVAAGTTREETEHLIQEAIEFHVEGLLLDGTPLPKPSYDAEKRGIAAV